MTALEVAVDDAGRRSKTGDWTTSKGSTLVGLYAFCHRLTYAVLPDELREQPLFVAASKNAARMVHEHFDDDFGAAVVFIVWSWEREKRRDTWARQNGIDRNRLSWRLQFSSALITDWKIERQRRRR